MLLMGGPRHRCRQNNVLRNCCLDTENQHLQPPHSTPALQLRTVALDQVGHNGVALAPVAGQQQVAHAGRGL